VGLVYDLRELPGVRTARPRVAGVLHNGDLNGGEPKAGGACPPGGDPHGGGGGGWPPGCLGYGCMGKHQNPGLQGGQNPAKGGGGHVGGASGAGDPPVYSGLSAWLL
jgi:hypothetical protein